MNSLQLHRDWVQHFTRLGLKATKPQRVNLALLCQALAVSPNCHLATLALGLPLPGQRENLVQRLRRFLKNDLRVAECYEPWVRHLFAHWSGREVSLVMDRTDIENRWSIPERTFSLTLGVTYRHRLLPWAWEVLPFGGTSAPTASHCIGETSATSSARDLFWRLRVSGGPLATGLSSVRLALAGRTQIGLVFSLRRGRLAVSARAEH